MQHPKAQFTYVGIDSHKDTHTAAFLDCFFDKLGEIQFENLPSKFPEFLENASKLRQDGTTLLFGLEDISAYGRTLAVFLKGKGQLVKHVNALLVARERKNQTVTQKTDSVDATCAARVLLSKFGELPDAQPDHQYWILRTLVTQRDYIVRNNTSLKNNLHSLLMQSYPNYRSFFENIDGNTSLAFYLRYPSPSTLEGTSVEELTEFLYEPSQGKVGAAKAREILGNLQDTAVPLQEIRDEAVRSVVRRIQSNLAEIKVVESRLAEVLASFETTLTSMTGIDIVSAAQMLSCIGDIRRFPTAAKLARYAGIAPVTYASGKTDKQFVSHRGNRELNSIFYQLAVRLVATTTNNRVRNHFFYSYYHKKMAEGKTKRQALKCVERRLVNIVWTMLTYGEEYVNPPLYDLPKESKIPASRK